MLVYPYKLMKPPYFIGIAGGAVLDDYISGIVSKFKVDREEFMSKLEALIPDSICIERSGNSHFFYVTADTQDEARRIINLFRLQFKLLIANYTPSVRKIKKYGSLVYEPY